MGDEMIQREMNGTNGRRRRLIIRYYTGAELGDRRIGSETSE
jgi:hypothetical protein